MATKQVNIDIIAKDKTRKAMQSATKGVDNLKGSVQQSVAHQQKSFSALGNTVKNVVAGVVVFQALRFGKQMINMASSVQEMQSKSSVVFGKFVGDVRGQLEEFGNAVGRSTFELEQMASTIQDTFVPMGFARGEASKLSVELTKLAVDVASFNNASDTDTMMAFQSALVGNHETVRRFGVVITEATLKQELLRMGVNKSAKEITNQEKVLARMNLILAGTSDAHGDATETSGSFANQSKALSSALDELIVFGVMPLLPALTKVVTVLGKVIQGTEKFLRLIGLIPKDLGTVIKQNLELSLLYEEEEKALEKLNRFVDKRSKITEQKNIDAIRLEIKAIQDMQSARAMALAGKERERVILIEKNRALAKQLKLEADLAKTQALPMSRPVGLIAPSDGTAYGQDASMKALTKLDVLKNMAIQELALEQEIFENKYKVTQERDELLAELRRINAEDTLTLAYETAEKEKAIRKKAFDDNFNLIKSGKAGEINLDKMAEKDKSDLAVKVGREALDQLAQNNKQAFALNKAFKIKDAIMSTAQGVSSALGKGNIPLAIAIGALGAVQVATIMSTKYQGRKQGGRMNQGQPYLVGEAGPEVVVPDKASNVVPNGQLGGMGKQVNVNFNITTVDATGFSELLVNSRATIVNVINQALNEKGKEVLV